MSEINKREVLELMRQDGNDYCADCGKKDPDWAAITFGAFVCWDCSGIHRSLGAHISKIKSVQLDDWKDADVQMMRDNGNLAVNKRLEESVPVCWKKPVQTDSLVCREQWIRAKYERKEFVHGPNGEVEKSYVSGKRKGFLHKRKKDSNSWNSRYFLLDGETLRYYKKVEDPKPKECIPLLDLNITLNGVSGRPNGMQMTALVKGKTRNYFVYADTGQEMIEWFCAIRQARLQLLKMRYPRMPDIEIHSRLSRDFHRHGYLLKTPPLSKAHKKKAPFQKRWFVLDHRRLMYFIDPMDASPLGEILLGSEAEGFKLLNYGSKELSGGEFCFTLITPVRPYDLIPVPETAEEKQLWMNALQKAIQDCGKHSELPHSNTGTTYEMD